MASTFKVPGVYVQEISKLPASVAQVATAVPAFVGYTQKTTVGPNIPTRITSLAEYEQHFGGSPNPRKITVTLDVNDNVETLALDAYFLYDSMQLYFANGGGPCYVVSVGDYEDSISYTAINAGIDTLLKEDEPTILLCPDAASLNPDDLSEVQKRMLQQCNKLQDRFSIFDLPEIDSGNLNDAVTDFRDKIGTQYLKYGAAYGPMLRTTLPLNYSYSSIVDGNGDPLQDALLSSSTYLTNVINGIADIPEIEELLGDDPNGAGNSYATQYNSIVNSGDPLADIAEDLGNLIKTMAIDFGGITLTNTTNTSNRSYIIANSLKDIIFDLYAYGISGIVFTPFTSTPFSYTLPSPPTPTVFANLIALTDALKPLFDRTLESIIELRDQANTSLSNAEKALAANDSIYKAIITAINERGIVLPPSGAVAGIYASVDRDRGVWKAPANISLNGVKEPVEKVDNQDQEDYNLHSTGKSVNIIRTFQGKGILIWGARTLDGNSNEWRYINVRRLFITAEESIKKATEFVVFEGNDANTWNKVKAMIENYLTGLWKDGALVGAKPDEAFYVNVGLGSTMTAQDILEGRLIVEIGMAAVRPAEFIILNFSHKLQTS